MKFTSEVMSGNKKKYTQVLKSFFNDLGITDICGSYNIFDLNHVIAEGVRNDGQKSVTIANMANENQNISSNLEIMPKKTEAMKEVKPEPKNELVIEIKKEINVKTLVKKADKNTDEILIEELQNIAKNYFSIEEIKNYLNTSDFCEIKKLSNNTVLFEGNLTSKIMLIGEAPGEEEDKLGVPFCGRSGKLLNNVLASIGLNRESNLYITNSVFWRPPNNRKPNQDEVERCKIFLLRQIEIIKPKFIILCGATALESMLGKDAKISDSRGKILELEIIKGEKIFACAIYHPSYLLRNPSAKKLAWIDMMFIKNQISQLI